MRGRKPKPTALHKLHGTLNATRHADRASEPAIDGDLLVDPPDWLTAQQQAGWRYAIAHAPRGILKKIDLTVLAIWVEAEDRHRTAAMMQARLDAETKLPLLTKTKDGGVAISPYVRIMTGASLVLMKAASELGFSPASRPRLAQRVGDLAGKTSAWAGLKVISGGKDAA